MTTETSSRPQISVIICSIDAYKFAQTAECYAGLLAGIPHEIIGIHDAQSLAEGYNRGMAQSVGDLLVFSHDDVLFLDADFGTKIVERMKNWDLLGFAGTSHLIYPLWSAADWPHLHGVVCHPYYDFSEAYLHLSVYGVTDYPVTGNIQALDGLCLIARRTFAQHIGFDDKTFDGWHLYDLDFSFAAHLAGGKVGVCCDIPYIHATTSVQSSKNTLAGNAYTEYARRFFMKYQPHMHPEHTPPKHPYGLSCHFPGHHALLAAWNEATLKRATLAMRRNRNG
jgi:GT2 family glycosyltransferase